MRCSFNGVIALAASINKGTGCEAFEAGILGPFFGLDANMEDLAFHQPVLLREAVEHLAVRPGGVYVDATVGEGGHASSLLQASAPLGVVLGVDRDPRSLLRAQERLREFGDRFIGIQGNYADAVQMVRSSGFNKVEGFLLDLGFSSRQVDAEGYGFSFQRDEPLDMRYDPAGQSMTAADIVNSHSEKELMRLFFEYGEEPRARAAARAIVQGRPINTTVELATLVAQVIHPGRGRKVNPATRVFQALRIAVNDELTNVGSGLAAAIELLNEGGRVAVISYHSLEDRLVKNTLVDEATGCICPLELPVCVCEHQATLRIINRRIIRPAAEEVAANPRCRSARMRVAERV